MTFCFHFTLFYVTKVHFIVTKWRFLDNYFTIIFILKNHVNLLPDGFTVGNSIVHVV